MMFRKFPYLIHMIFVGFVGVCKAILCSTQLQFNNIENNGEFVLFIFDSPAIRAKDLLLVQTCLSIGVLLDVLSDSLKLHSPLQV